MTESNEEPRATQAAKEKAEELGVDLSHVQATGKKGERTRQDVERYHAEEQRVMSEGEEEAEGQAIAEVQETEPQSSFYGRRLEIGEDSATESPRKVNNEQRMSPVVERAVQLEQDTRRMETRSGESPLPEMLEEILTDDEKNIIKQYNVLRVVLAGPLALEKTKLPAPMTFPSDPSTDFAPAIPPDWKPLTDSTASLPAVTVCPTCLDFGSQIVGTESNPETVMCINTGTEPVEITSVDLTGPMSTDFRLGPGSTCTDESMLQWGGTCIVEAVFKPSEEGPRAALLIFDTSRGQLVVPLIGQGDPNFNER